MTVSVDRLVRSRCQTIARIGEGNGSLTVRAPLDRPDEAIQAFVEQHAKILAAYREHRDWLKKNGKNRTL